ncbi:PepSY domain-containing protein [Castellaniella caeni]|uniref:PepSY domain-containing protein n=1 Tax=Castellaniella caeni TaxID=266123 RepID=UPI000C9FB439|nr:PepSY domain-containing protein [Castellaniella caeni]
MRHRHLLASVLVLGVLGTTVALAHNHDRTEAERLQQMGEVLPLSQVLSRVASEYPGQVLKVEFEDDDDFKDCSDTSRPCTDRWIYELKILQDQGRLVKLKVDAHTGQVLWVGRRPLRGQGKHE